MSLPTTHKLTPTQIAELESEDRILRGTAGLAIYRDAIKETGAVVPEDYLFREMDQSIVPKALDAVFALRGGVPALLIWAETEQTEFYKLWVKSKAKDQLMVAAGNVTIVSNLPASPLDNRTIDAEGFVTAHTVDPDEDDV